MPEKNLAEYTSSEELRDLIVRIKETESYGPEVVSVFQTRDLMYPFANLYLENGVLRSVIANQWRSYKYNQEYTKYLLGGYAEEEFLSVAEKFAIPFKRIDKDQLCYGVSVVLNILGETITSGDLSTLFNVDPADVDVALESCSFVTADKGIDNKEGDEKK